MQLIYKMKATLLLLAAMLSFGTAFAETGTETEPSTIPGKDNPIEGQSYTIAGTYNAGGGGAQAGNMTSKGFKCRTGSDGNRVVFSVNTGYTITKFVGEGISNYAMAEGAEGDWNVKVTKVEVDGTEVAFTGGEFPAKGASTSGNITISDIQATESIAIYFDSSNSAGKQVNLCFAIDWSRADAAQPTIKVSPKSVSLIPGASYKLSVKVDPASFTTQWVSDNEAVATVAEDGTVTAVGPGTANISNQWTDNASVADAAVITVADFDPAQYDVVESYDFTTMGDVTLTLQTEAAGAIWNEANKKVNNVFFCTNEGLENIAVQAAVDSNKGWSIVAEKGLFLAGGAGRCAAIGNLKAGQVVEINYTGEGFFTGNHEDATRKDDGALKTGLNEGVGRAIYKMDEDGLLGFELIKGNSVTSIIVYGEKGTDPENPYSVIWNEGATYGNEGGFFALPVNKFAGVKAADIMRITVAPAAEEARAEAPMRTIKNKPSVSLWKSADEGETAFQTQELPQLEAEQTVDFVIDDATLAIINEEGRQNILVKGVNINIKQVELVEGAAPAPILDQTINHERTVGMGYGVTKATVDFAAAKEYLGVDAITTDMLRIENPDGELISDYATFDGWFNGEGKAETWGSNTKVCVKFFQAIPDGEFEICDMNQADEAGKTYTVKWQLVSGEKAVRYTINVKFIEAEQIAPEVIATVDVPVTLKAATAYEGATATFDAADMASKLGLTSLADASAYIVNVTTGEFVMNTTDGWRDANGDAASWGSGAGMVCVKINDPASGTIDYLGAIDDTYQAGATYTAKWGFVNAQNKAVVLNINITFNDPDGITNVEGNKQQNAPVYNLAGQRMQKVQKGLYIVNGKKFMAK